MGSGTIPVVFGQTLSNTGTGAQVKAKEQNFLPIFLSPLVSEKLKNILIILRIHCWFRLGIPESLKYIICWGIYAAAFKGFASGIRAIMCFRCHKPLQVTILHFLSTQVHKNRKNTFSSVSCVCITQHALEMAASQSRAPSLRKIPTIQRMQ